MRRGNGDDAACFKGLGHDFAATAVAVVNQPLDCKRCSRRFEPNKQHLRDEVALRYHRGNVESIPFGMAFPSPAPMSPSTQNAPSVEQVRLRRLVARRAGKRGVCLPIKTVYLVHAATVTLR